jgi:hypothetical protein
MRVTSVDVKHGSDLCVQVNEVNGLGCYSRKLSKTPIETDLWSCSFYFEIIEKID